MKDKNIVKTVEELEQFVNTHKDCEVYGIKELDDILNRGCQFSLSKTSEEIDLSFKVMEISEIMLNKGIRYRRIKNER